MTFGSVCSGIEAASLAFKNLDLKPLWFSEIAPFPNNVLKYHYPDIPNLGDMNNISELIMDNKVETPDILCGGTPCQAFSLAGWKKGLVDKRGQLTLSFIDIANTIDQKRLKKKKKRATILWENVEGVLKDKTNAFGIFISGLAGLSEEISLKKWQTSGILKGSERNIAWRVLDAKYFGLPQQRKRLFVIATGVDENPEQILFEITKHNSDIFNYKNFYKENLNNNFKDTLFAESTKSDNKLKKIIEKNKCEVFREYTDCLYSAYGTKWNGNAAAYNGSLYIAQNSKVRRLSPLECERLMGFPDNYTNIPGNKDTTRYQAVGNSWAIPVITWIGERIVNYVRSLKNNLFPFTSKNTSINKDYKLQLLDNDFTYIEKDLYLNSSSCPNDYKIGDIFDIIDVKTREKFYISPKGSAGILRRKNERSIKMNNRLEELFIDNLKPSIQNSTTSDCSFLSSARPVL